MQLVAYSIHVYSFETHVKGDLLWKPVWNIERKRDPVEGSAVEHAASETWTWCNRGFMSIGAGSRFDRDRRSWRRLNAGGGRWRLLVPANDSARIRGSWCRCCQWAIAQCTGWSWLQEETGWQAAQAEIIPRKIWTSPEDLIWKIVIFNLIDSYFFI